MRVADQVRGPHEALEEAQGGGTGIKVPGWAVQDRPRSTGGGIRCSGRSKGFARAQRGIGIMAEGRGVKLECGDCPRWRGRDIARAQRGKGIRGGLPEGGEAPR